MMQGTSIKECDCVHEYQDKKYGKGKRVHNVAGGRGAGFLRCTSCGKDKRAPLKGGK